MSGSLSGLVALVSAEPVSPAWLAGMRLWLGVIGFFVFFLGAAWLLRRASRHGLAGRAGMRLRVIEQLPLSRDAYVTLLKAGDRVLLIGVSKAGLCLLGDLSGDGVLTGTEAASQDPAVWPESPLTGLVSLFKRKPAAPAKPEETHPSFAALMHTIQAENESTGHPVSEPPTAGRSGDGRENGQNYNHAIRQLDALNRWRSTPPDAPAEPERPSAVNGRHDGLDDAIDRMAARAGRYGRRDGRQP